MEAMAADHGEAPIMEVQLIQMIWEAEDAAQQRKRFHVAVVVDGRLAVRFQVVRIDEVEIGDVAGGRLVGDVDRMFQGQVPYRECLEFGVAGMQASLMVVIQL